MIITNYYHCGNDDYLILFCQHGHKPVAHYDCGKIPREIFFPNFVFAAETQTNAHRFCQMPTSSNYVWRSALLYRMRIRDRDSIWVPNNAQRWVMNDDHVSISTTRSQTVFCPFRCHLKASNTNHAQCTAQRPHVRTTTGRRSCDTATSGRVQVHWENKIESICDIVAINQITQPGNWACHLLLLFFYYHTHLANEV